MIKDDNKSVAEEPQCRCDLDNWEPDRRTGHTWVCPIHKAMLIAEKKEKPILYQIKPIGSLYEVKPYGRNSKR